MRSSRLSLNAWVSRSTARCLATPYSELSQLLSSRARPKNLGETIRELDNLIENAVRTRGYLDMRYGHGCGDGRSRRGTRCGAVLRDVYGPEAGDARYDARGRATPALKVAHDYREAARVAWEAAREDFQKQAAREESR